MEWNRFCKVVAKDFRNMWPMFGTTMLILAVLPFAVWLFIAVLGGDSSMPPDIRLIMIEGVAYIAAIMAPSRMYRTWNLRNEGIYYAMLPASKAEKFCSALLFSLIICPLAVFLGSMALDIFLTALPFGPWRDWLWQGEMGFPFTFDFTRLGELAGSEEGAQAFEVWYGTLFTVCCWLGYIGSVACFLFTSTIFKKHKVLQTLLWLYVIQFVLSLISMPIMISVFNSDGFMEWMQIWFEGMTEQQAVGTFFGWAIGLNVVEIGLFGYFAWWRLKRMAY